MAHILVDLFHNTPVQRPQVELSLVDSKFCLVTLVGPLHLSGYVFGHLSKCLTLDRSFRCSWTHRVSDGLFYIEDPAAAAVVKKSFLVRAVIGLREPTFLTTPYPGSNVKS